MKELLSGKHKLKHDENVALAKECSAIIQRNLPPKLTDPCRFTIPFSIGPLTIIHALCDLGDIINLIPLSIMRKLNYGERKPTQMTLTLVNYYITYPYGAIIDVKLDKLTLRFNKEKVVFNMFEAMKHQKENLQCYRIDGMEEVVQEVNVAETLLSLMDSVIINPV
ncbi:uncharacterized protein LOC127093733 [Lathyrus oleraceus]|uniref:uncharacterized protein LOC127093733 n=1 Tax=Pisum sativum TaxID=3888 RepID=UPI0021CF567F|nr:uncharacterized protein LOC127093733 [Pisum sativum]